AALSDPGQPLVSFELDSPDHLAIQGLGMFRSMPVAGMIRRNIEDWHISDFQARAAGSLSERDNAEHLSSHGENLALVARNLYENHPDRFQALLERMKRHVP